MKIPHINKDDKFQLSLLMDKDMADKILAISFHLGRRGRYSLVIRRFIGEGIDNYIKSLDDLGRAAFDLIVTQVREKSDTEYQRKIDEKTVAPG